MTTRDEYQTRLTEFLGERLARVRYMELGLTEGGPPWEPRWNEHGDHDSIDYGVELSFDSGLTRRLEWWHDFDWHTVTLWDGPFEGNDQTPRFDVSRASRWEPLLGDSIVHVETTAFAARLTEGGSVQTVPTGGAPDGDPWAPYVSALTFARGAQVWIATYECRERGSMHIQGADHISVFFDRDAARAHGVLPYANLE